MRGMAVPTTDVFRAISMKARQIPTIAASDARKLRTDCGISDFPGVGFLVQRLRQDRQRVDQGGLCVVRNVPQKPNHIVRKKHIDLFGLFGSCRRQVNLQTASVARQRYTFYQPVLDKTIYHSADPAFFETSALLFITPTIIIQAASEPVFG